MRGGKRQGAGRKNTYQTKTIRIPIDLETKILELINEYKANINPNGKDALNSVTESISRTKQGIPILNDDQKKRVYEWLVETRMAQGWKDAMNMTRTPEECQYWFKKGYVRADAFSESKVKDIIELYGLKWT